MSASFLWCWRVALLAFWSKEPRLTNPQKNQNTWKSVYVFFLLLFIPTLFIFSIAFSFWSGNTILLLTTKFANKYLVISFRVFFNEINYFSSFASWMIKWSIRNCFSFWTWRRFVCFSFSNVNRDVSLLQSEIEFHS